MFSKAASYYDRIYAFKDYQAEVRRLRSLLAARGVGVGDGVSAGDGGRLLDVACGTGGHLDHLRAHYEVEGLDISPELLAIARRKHPDIVFHEGDMVDFDLGRRFDLVTCLFSSIGYVKTIERAAAAIACMARHLNPAGVLVIEPWFVPEEWRPGTVHAVHVEDTGLKIARVGTSLAKGTLSYFDLHYLIGTSAGTEHVVERHELGLFSQEQIQEALTAAGLRVSYDQEGLTGRGLYLASLR